MVPFVTQHAIDKQAKARRSNTLARAFYAVIVFTAPAWPVLFFALFGYDSISTASGTHTLILACASIGALSLYMLFRRPLAPLLYVAVAWGVAWIVVAYAACAIWGDCL